MEYYEATLEEGPEYRAEYVEAKIKPEQERTVTPTAEGFDVTPDAGCVLSRVTVEPIPEATDDIEITANGDVDVRNKRTAHVEVPVPPGYVLPEGQQIFTTDGTYDVTTLETAIVSTSPEIGVVLSDFNANGLPQAVRTVGMTVVPIWLFYADANVTTRTYLLSQIKTITFNEGVTTLKQSCCRGLKNLKKVVFPSTLTVIEYYTFMDCTAVEEYDFSACLAIPEMAMPNTFKHASGCVIKVPAGLLDEWQAAESWRDLTGVVWQGVE